MGEPKRKFSNFLSRWLHSEFKPLAFCPKVPGSDKTNPEARLESGVARWRWGLAVAFNWAAEICVYVYWVFGTLLFSSTLFIGTVDALEIVVTYLGSALLAREVLFLELLEFDDGKEGAEEAEATDECAGAVWNDMVASCTTQRRITHFLARLNENVTK